MIDSNWHEAVPPTMHLSISDVKDGSASDCDSLEGDYLLSLVETSPNGCRWELAFSTVHDFSQVAIVAAPDFVSGEYELRAFFEGTVAGPQWSTKASSVARQVDLDFDSQAVPIHLLRCQWPGKVIATPMQAALPTRGHYISPSPTQSELAATIAATGTSCSSFDPNAGPSCPECDPEDVNCGCGTRPTGLWCAGFPHQMYVRPFTNQPISCEGVECTGTIRIRIHGIRVHLTPPGPPDNRCTCFFYTRFQIEFLHSDITCPGGVTCDPFSTYLNGGNLWPGRWVQPGGCLAEHASWYLDECVTTPTHAGFDMDKFLEAMGDVPPNCNGDDQTPDCPQEESCPDVPESCP